jgi:hypothetical protein
MDLYCDILFIFEEEFLQRLTKNFVLIWYLYLKYFKKPYSSNRYGTQDKIEKEEETILEICTMVYIYLIYS